MITEETVRHVAKLARLALNDEEIKTYTHQLGDILTYIDQLNAVDTEGIPPTARAFPLHNVMREDQVVAERDLPTEVALANAPDREDSFFRIPKIA